MNSTRSLLVCAVAALVMASGCHRFLRPSDRKPMQVDVRVSGLKAEDQDTLETELGEIPGVQNVRRDPFGEATVYTFEYSGDFARLERAIESIEYPGLRPKESIVQLYYEGYDNRPPAIEVLSPEAGEVQTDTRVTIVVEVKDTDVASVTIGGQETRRRQPHIYEATLELPEGEQEVELVATDDAENETRETFEFTIDTTPPEMEATVKVVVEGKVEPGSTVFVDGEEAQVNAFGKWRAEVEVKRGQKTVEVVAIDQAGNKKVEQKPIGL